MSGDYVYTPGVGCRSRVPSWQQKPLLLQFFASMTCNFFRSLHPWKTQRMSPPKRGHFKRKPFLSFGHNVCFFWEYPRRFSSKDNNKTSKKTTLHDEGMESFRKHEVKLPPGDNNIQNPQSWDGNESDLCLAPVKYFFSRFWRCFHWGLILI